MSRDIGQNYIIDDNLILYLLRTLICY